MPRQTKKVRISENKLEDTISRGENSGRIGIITDRFRVKKEIPDVAKQADFPNKYNLRSKTTKFGKTTGLNRTKYEQTKYKEQQTNMSGKESSKINNFEFQGQKPLVYNPFAQNAGFISDVGGYNAGGDEEFSNIKQTGEVLPVDYQLGARKNQGLRMIVNPEKENPVVKPGGKVRVRSKLRIR
tara:strand:+ start:1814 stop:2365 length:552 start_codon:yes stop_codon:yes gene_type:complete